MSVSRLLAMTLLAALAPSLRAAFPRAYKGAIVVDAGTGAVLYADHADEMSPPASMTKLMTFAVVDDYIRRGAFGLGTPVTATADDARVGAKRDSTSVWLRRGEVFSVEELIYAAMIQSANDAAWALAEFSAGSVPAFVAQMNAKAEALGMTRTRFRSPNGLPMPSHRIADGDLTTPRDFALLCRYLIERTDILRYTSVRVRDFGAGRRFPPVRMINHNYLLGRIEGVDGLKTGFTDGAGFCLSATARRGGKRIIVVLMGSPDQRSRNLRVAELIDLGFARAISEGLTPGPETPSAPLREPVAPTRPAIQFAVPGQE